VSLLDVILYNPCAASVHSYIVDVIIRIIRLFLELDVD
jgi:hypothetical protein